VSAAGGWLLAPVPSRSLARVAKPAAVAARLNADFPQLTESDLPELQAYPASHWLLTASGNPLPVGYLLRNPDQEDNRSQDLQLAQG